MKRRGPLHLFEATGVELEYMIVDRQGLDLRPAADRILQEGGECVADVERGPIQWGNELVLHVIELRGAAPLPRLTGMAEVYQKNVREIDALLAESDAMVLPTAMHPWMDPDRETRLWPHEYNEIYRTFDRIFDCRGHGWSNLQSTHINLPFADDEEFGRLHAAIRVLLPILPALAASSPIAGGQVTGWLDTRLEEYRKNARRVPSVTGDVVPEPAFSRREYESNILQRIYDDLAPLDPRGVIRHEWVNARGAIPRFDRRSIEIRVLDIQECPRADLATCAAIVSATKALVEESLAALASYRDWPQENLVRILRGVTREADGFSIADRSYLRLLGYDRRSSCTAGELWRHIIDGTLAREAGSDEWAEPLETLLCEGCLARRILAALGDDSTRERMRDVYRRLADCLAAGELFHAQG